MLNAIRDGNRSIELDSYVRFTYIGHGHNHMRALAEPNSHRPAHTHTTHTKTHPPNVSQTLEMKRIGKVAHEPDLDYKLGDWDRECNGEKFLSFSFSFYFHSSCGAQWEINTQIGIYRRGKFTNPNLRRSYPRKIVKNSNSFCFLFNYNCCMAYAEISIPVQRLIKIILSEIWKISICSTLFHRDKCLQKQFFFVTFFMRMVLQPTHIVKDCLLGIIR